MSVGGCTQKVGDVEWVRFGSFPNPVPLLENSLGFTFSKPRVGDRFNVVLLKQDDTGWLAVEGWDTYRISFSSLVDKVFPFMSTSIIPHDLRSTGCKGMVVEIKVVEEGELHRAEIEKVVQLTVKQNADKIWGNIKCVDEDVACQR